MTEPKITFASTGLCTPLLKKLEREGYDTPTPIQASAIGHILAGKDVVGLAQTGTGKTAAFTLPLLQRVDAALQSDVGHGNVARPIRVLILTPTRELAAQIDKAVRNYGENLTTRSACVVGGVSLRAQIKPLRQGVDVLVATPGRLEDILGQKIITLDWVDTVVLDEADQMLDIGFMPAIKRILALTPKNRQTLLFSATMPRQIRELSNRYMKKPVEITVSPASKTADNVAQSVMFVGQPDKTTAAIEILMTHKGERAILFSRTKRGCDRIAKRLNASGLNANAIHGNKSQNNRTKTLDAFRAGQVDILVATDVAARGIDIPGVELVLNFDLPQVAEAYVHRIGRTGRAGKSGLAIAFCNPEENAMLRDIERVIKQRIPLRSADGKVEKELDWDPVANPNAARTFNHIKTSPDETNSEPYVADSHTGKRAPQNQGHGEKRRPHGGSTGAPKRQKNRRRKVASNTDANSPAGSKASTQTPTFTPVKTGQKSKPLGGADANERSPKKQNKKNGNKRNRPGSRARKRHRGERQNKQ